MNPAHLTQFSEVLAADLERLVQQVARSLVLIRGRQGGAGSGVVISPDGVILTNHHVIGRRPARVLLADNREFEARMTSADPAIDLALLHIPASGLAAIPLASPDRLRVGELVFALGHPWGQRNTVTSGIISALGRAEIRGPGNVGSRTIPIIRSDVPLAPGNSGGPLVNMAGEVLGINAMIVGGDQSVAIPAWVARQFIDQTSTTSRANPHPARPRQHNAEAYL